MPTQSEKVEIKLVDGRVFQIDPEAVTIIAYDENVLTYKQMKGLVEYIMASGKIAYAPALLGYNGAMSSDPLKFYEVKHANSK